MITTKNEEETFLILYQYCTKTTIIQVSVNYIYNFT